MNKAKCHICGKDTDPDYFCRDCGELMCEDCHVPYDQFTRVDYNLCVDCQAVGCYE